jgi:hypothetical protein
MRNINMRNKKDQSQGQFVEEHRTIDDRGNVKRSLYFRDQTEPFHEEIQEGTSRAAAVGAGLAAGFVIY